MRKQFRKKQKQDRLLNKDGISAGMNKGTLLLHLTSTFFPMLLFLALANSEHPDWNQFSSRETGLCPSSMLVRQQADSPQQRLDTVKLEAAGLGCQLCLGRVVGGRTKAPSVPTEVATLEVRPHGAHWAPPDRSLSLAHSLFFPSFLQTLQVSWHVLFFYLLCRKRMTLVKQYNLRNYVFLTFAKNSRITNPLTCHFLYEMELNCWRNPVTSITLLQPTGVMEISFGTHKTGFISWLIYSDSYWSWLFRRIDIIWIFGADPGAAAGAAGAGHFRSQYQSKV